MKNKKLFSLFWLALISFVFAPSLEARETSVQLHLLQVEGLSKRSEPGKGKTGPKLAQKKFSSLVKNLLADYHYQWYKLLKKAEKTVKEGEKATFVLQNNMILEITPQKKKEAGWIYLKIQIKAPQKKKDKDKDKKKKYKKVVSLVQKIKNGASFLMRLKHRDNFKLKKGALFLVIEAKEGEKIKK